MILKVPNKLLTMKLVPATVEDIPELIDLIQYSFRGDRGWCRDNHLIEGTRVTREMLEKDLSCPDGLLWKCFIDDESKSGKRIIAAVYSEKQPETNMMYVGRLCVHPDYQTQGLGKTLMRKVEERAISLKCSALTLQVVFARQDLIQWYEKQGFRLTGERESLENGVYGNFLVAPELLDLVTLQKDL